MAQFQEPTSTRRWLTEWAALQFGDDAAEAASSIMTTYGKLVARRKYEDLSMTPFAFSTVNYDEAELNLDEWVKLGESAQAVYDKLPASTQPSFFEVVLHPILAGKAVFEIYTKAALATKYAGEKRQSTNELAKQAQAAFQTDKDIKKRWNSLLGGKWNKFMDQTHLGYNNWQQPAQDSIPRLASVTGTSGGGGKMGVVVQGGTSNYPAAAAALTLGAITPYTPEQRWIDVFARDTGSFAYQITSNTSFVSVTNAQGTVTSPSDVRALVRVDWAAAPTGPTTVALTVTADAAAATVLVPVRKLAAPAGFAGHVEAPGYVSVEAAHFDAAGSGAEYQVLPGYGRTHGGVRLPPRTASQAAGSGPSLAYPFVTFSEAAAPELTAYLAPSENANPTSPNRYAFSVDGGPVTTVQPVPLANAGGEPPGWAGAVVAGAYVKTSKLGGRLPAGTHVLRVWLLEPTMVLTKLVVDLGGVKSSALGPPESVIVGR